MKIECTTYGIESMALPLLVPALELTIQSVTCTAHPTQELHASMSQLANQKFKWFIIHYIEARIIEEQQMQPNLTIDYS